MFNSFTTTWILSDGYQTALGYPIKPLLHLIRFHHSDAWKPLSHFRLLCHFFVSPISPFNSKHISSKSHPMSWHSVPSPPRSRRGPCLCPRTFWRAEKMKSYQSAMSNERQLCIIITTEPLSHWATEPLSCTCHLTSFRCRILTWTELQGTLLNVHRKIGEIHRAAGFNCQTAGV